MQETTVKPNSRYKMPEQSAVTGVAPARDQGFDIDSNISSTASLDEREEKGHNRWPVTLQYPLHELLGVIQGDHAMTTKNIKGCIVKTFKYICFWCDFFIWLLLQIGISTLCIRIMTEWAPSKFEMSMHIDNTGVTPYIDPPDISVIFKREHNWQDPTCSEGWLEDLKTNDFGLGGSGAWSPTFMARFNSMSEPHPWILTSSDPQLTGPESYSSYTAYVEGIRHEDRPPTYDTFSSSDLYSLYTAYVEGIRHEDRPPTYDTISSSDFYSLYTAYVEGIRHEDRPPPYDTFSSSDLGESWGVRLDKDLEEPLMENSLLTAESCNLLTSCCILSLDIYYSDTIIFVLKGLLKDVTIISADQSSIHTSQDQRRLGSRFHKLMLTFIVTYIIHLITLLVQSIVHGHYANTYAAFRSGIHYYLEPRLAFGNKRVRWICAKCGRPLYDDFHEIQPGAIAKLQQDLYERYENTNRRANSGSSGSPNNPQDGRSRNSKSFFGQWWSCWRSSAGRSPTLPLHQGQNVPSQDPDIARARCSSEKVFLLLCIPHRKWATKLVHMDLCTLLSDQLFFTELRTQYKSMQGKWRSWFTLKQLTRIQFVQFELHKNELVDIRLTNVLPPETRDDYRYRPAPPEFIPPVGENLLMHLYEHPEDADDDSFCLDRIPKKLRERLVRPQRGRGVGWGVYFNEGLSLKKMCIFGLLGLFFSALFGVIWSVKRDDVQGGFSVAAFLMAALTFTTGIVQATLEPK